MDYAEKCSELNRRDSETCAAEYAFIREEAMGSIGKQDRCFFLVYGSLGLLALFLNFEKPIQTLVACLVALVFVVALQSKIIEYRNILYYTSSYLILLENNCVSFRWERRFAKFFDMYSKLYGSTEVNNGKSLGIKYRRELLRRISWIKHFLNTIIAVAIFVLMISLTFLCDVFPLGVGMCVAASILVLVSFALTFFVIWDKPTKERYKEVWERIAVREGGMV